MQKIPGPLDDFTLQRRNGTHDLVSDGELFYYTIFTAHALLVLFGRVTMRKDSEQCLCRLHGNYQRDISISSSTDQSSSHLLGQTDFASPERPTRSGPERPHAGAWLAF